jgi:predicted peptidase
MGRPLLFLLATAAFSAGLIRPVGAAEIQTVHSFESSGAGRVGYSYLLALPKGYALHGEKRWPLILFLHGSGERGDDVWRVARHGPPKLLRAGESGPAAIQLAENFIVVSPQCPKGTWWDNDSLLELLDELTARHNVDPRRVYLTGLSMGGYGTWDLGLAHPERFAAILAICGGGTFATVSQLNTRQRQALLTLGVWAFHGAKDYFVPLARSTRMVDMLKNVQVEDVKLTVYPEVKHDSWTATYANPEIYTWLLRHQRIPVRKVN